MKGVFKAIFSALLGRQSVLAQASDSADLETLSASSSVQEPSAAQLERANSLRCERILNYWLDTELFDLPECPLDRKKDIISHPAEKFLEHWGDITAKIEANRLHITEKSRLLIMFQCHRAGYIIQQDEQAPDYEIPRTYLVAQAMIPQWDAELQQLTWLRSDENQDVVFNIATIRTLYRRCNSSIPSNMSLAQWFEARVESIENILQGGLDTEEHTPLTSAELQQRIIRINRELADEFWPDQEARNYMLQQCQPIESSTEQEAKEDTPGRLKNGAVTFRWRFCYYPEENESQQLGPFFVKDLENTIHTVSSKGSAGLSTPLRAYLLGHSQQIEIGNAANQGDFFTTRTTDLIRGRWPENPKYGLSLLQAFAVNVARQVANNPIVAVNGPPGTGKTTLLKDIIADQFVARTHALNTLSEKDNWLDDAEVFTTVLQHSMLVASSNNKAVENISKELPALSQLAEEFSESVSHFRELAPEGDWGLFCATLGNSANRTAFKKQLGKVRDHFKNINDIFSLNHFYNTLKKNGREGAAETITRFTTLWQQQHKLLALIADIKQCRAYTHTDHSVFLEPFTLALYNIEQGELSIEKFASIWATYSEEQWDCALESLEAFKRQWFGRKLYTAHREDKLSKAKADFQTLYAQLQGTNAADWDLDVHQHLISPTAYAPQAGESIEAAEQRLQLSSPLGSKKLNHYRSAVFASAVRLNEAILESSAEQFAKHWDAVEQLIDGRLDTTEDIPEHQQLWSILFLFFPVVSTSLSSAENQFKLMQKREGFGLLMIDEAGQAVNYHIVGLLQRCRQAIFVGDPIQLEPVVSMAPSIDRSIARDFLQISNQDGAPQWGDRYLVSSSSAQAMADRAGRYMAKIGERTVGIPLLVHRRCTEPMFSIANRIAYDNKMVIASQPYDWSAIPSGWIHVAEEPAQLKGKGYANGTEAATAIRLVQFLVEQHPDMVKGGVYIITPFSKMRNELHAQWKTLQQDASNHSWMLKALGTDKAATTDSDLFRQENIGTVHTFQGKEASTVIFCTAASKARKNLGGMGWVNSKPNLLNVAVTRAKHHLFVIGNQEDWAEGTLSATLQNTGMHSFANLENFMQQSACNLTPQPSLTHMPKPVASLVSFDFS